MAPSRRPAPLSAQEQAEFRAYLDAAAKPLQPAASRDEGLKLLRKLQFWIGASPIWWGRPSSEFDGQSPWNYILAGGDPEHLLRTVRECRRPLE